jgi:inorganic triphosphatase YgiF
MADYLEIEQKFDVDDDFKRPDFGALPGDVRAAAPVLLHLAAIYFDTADARLAGSNITLRRRTGGTDEGWTLKLPAGQDARRELREPFDGRDEVPERLAARVAEVTGGRPLAPIARVDTERTVVTLTGHDGRVVAEIADDTVTARRLAGSAEAATSPPLRWREIEVEVPEATPALQRAAASLLREAGARPAGHGSKLARVLDS